LDGNVDPGGMGFLSFLVNFFKMLLSIFTGGKFGWGPSLSGMPPIFSDLLGNTQATLNSIYHPIDPSKYTTAPFLPPGTDYYDPATGGGTGGNAWSQAVGECARKDFGVEMKSFTQSARGQNGTFVGWGTDKIRNGGNDATITIMNNVNRFSGDDLSDISRPTRPY
jgi:hypothetical protein